MKASLLCSALALICLAAHLSADVTINELTARTPERLLKYDSAGQPSLGAATPWFASNFDASPWSIGTAPFGYGSGGIATDLGAQIQGVVPSFYLRKTFTATSGQASSGTGLRLAVDYDDGFIAYLNGVEIARSNMGPAQMFIYADQPAFNPGTNTETINVGAASGLLTTGDNVLAIHVANRDINSSISFDGSLRLGTGGTFFFNTASTWDYTTGVIEPSGGIFEPAFIGASPALSVEWAQLGFGDSSWTTAPGPLGFDSISDYNLGTNLLQMRASQTTTLYMRRTFTATAGQIAAATALQLSVDYDDGYIIFLNGGEIARGNVGTPGDFAPHTATADGGHNASLDGGGNDPGQIENLTLNKNLLVTGTNILAAQALNSSGGSSDLLVDATLSTTGASPATLFTSSGDWNYFIGTAEPSAIPSAPPAAPKLEFSDWIELHNDAASTVDLTGWTLSDDSVNPSKWTFPAGTSIAAGGYLLVIADEQDGSGINTSYLHANFKLSGGGEFLGLYDNAGVARDVLSPGYPQQLDFQSYGTQPGGTALGFLDSPTPGAANTGTFYTGAVEKPDFDIPGGFHNSTVTLNITTATAGATIRYTTDGTEPTASSTAYSGALTLSQINSRTGHVIRARAFAAGMVSSKTKSATYLINQSANIRQAPVKFKGTDPMRKYALTGYGISDILL